MPGYEWNITYLNTTKQLVALSGGKLIFMKYDQTKKEYVKQSEVQVQDLHTIDGLQGIGTDGQVIYVADSTPGGSNSRVWTVTLDGKVVEEHRLGSEYKGGKEVEAALSDNDGNLWLICPQYFHRVSNYKANPANANPGSSSTSGYPNTTYQVKVATWTETRDAVDSDDPAVASYDTGLIPNMTATSIPYQAIVSKYKMPFNYLWTMLVYSEDKEYTFDLANLVKNSKIEITIHDNFSDIKTVVTDTYTDITRIKTEASVNLKYTDVSYKTVTNKDPTTNTISTETVKDSTDGSDTVEVTVDNYDNPIRQPYKVVHTTVNRNNTLDIALTLADAWCTKYEKKYTYNKLRTSDSNNSNTLENIVHDPEIVSGDFGGLQGKVDSAAKAEVSAPNREDIKVTGYNSVVATYNRSREERVNNIYTKMTTSSYTSGPGMNTGISSGGALAVTPKTGSLNRNNYVDLIKPKSDGDADNPIQGFCLVGDNLIAYVIHHNSGNVSTLYLADINTMQEYDHADGFIDHGNSIAYDSQTGEIIFPEVSTMKLVKVNLSTNRFESIRTLPLPEYAHDTPAVAYNQTHDLFISHKNIYTREAFYSGGKPFRQVEYSKLGGSHLNAGCTSYGNQIYYYYAEGYGYSQNYLIVCNINTGKQEEIIHDNMAAEGEEPSFSSDGTLYICHGVVNKPFQKTDYNYFSDNNIDKSNVSPNGGSGTSDIAKYNTGGEYTDKSSFQAVFNAHYKGRSNILNVKAWFFEALEQNADTEKMVELTKYLFYKATGLDFGVTEFDFEAYDPEGFNQVNSGIYGNTPQEKVWFALRGAGFSEYAVAGAMGNIEAESGFRQDAIEGGSGAGFGLCQWSFGRRTQLEKYAKSKGKNPSDINTQIEFLIGELTPGGGADGYANYQFGSNGENWKNASSVDQATEIYCRYFERPNMAVAHMDRRKEAAIKYYNEFHGKTAPTGGIGNGDVIKVCEEVTQHFLSRNVIYSVQGSQLISGNIEKCYNESNYICCSTYVSCVLYKSGLMAANHINKYGYHSTAAQTGMLEDAGWTKIPFSQAKPGDVVIHDPGPKGHALIYAGGNLCWDETSATSRTNSKVSKSSSYLSEALIYRAPGR